MPNEDTSRNTIVRNVGKLRKGNLVPQPSLDGLLYTGDLRQLPKKNYYMLGEKGSGTRPVGRLQDFDSLKANTLSKLSQDPKGLFKDPEFPAEDSSIGLSNYVKKLKLSVQKITWLRPDDIVRPGVSSQLFVEGPSRFDIKQNQIGDCWFLAATSALAMRKDLLYQVVPKEQVDAFQKDYAGIFHFRFWQYGRWVDVVIDDRLPTYAIGKGDVQLLGVRSSANNEFWAALLEKAYAKLNGTYEAINGGYGSRAMEDLTGGISESYTRYQPPKDDVYGILRQAQQKRSLIVCSFRQKTEGDGEESKNEKKSSGLYSGHEYNITDVRVVKNRNSENIRLVRLRNPWGSHEWKWAWSDESPEWKSVLKSERQELGLVPEDDGEFWISFEDFERFYHTFHICHLNPNEFSASSETKDWEINKFEGAWVHGATAGGCNNNPKMFQYNPQYRITLKEESTVVIALMQRNLRDRLPIGFEIYPLEKKLPKPLNLHFFEETKRIDITLLKTDTSAPESQQFAKIPEVGCRVKLLPGAYCIIPCTRDAGKEGKFLLRVISEKPNQMEEYDDEIAVDDENDKENNVALHEIYETLIEQYRKKYPSEDKELNWKGLKEILNSVFSENSSTVAVHFSGNVCRNLIAVLDKNESGKLGFEEFNICSKIIDKLWTAIKSSTTDGYTTYINTLALRKTLKRAGYHLDNHKLSKYVRRYATEDLRITFEDLVTCAMDLQAMVDESGTFHQLEQD